MIKMETKKMTADQKRQIMIEKHGERAVNELQSKVWLLISVLNTTMFAIAQLEPKKMQHLKKKRFNDLRMSVELFLNTLKSSVVDPLEIEILDNMVYENVGFLAEFIAMSVQVPEPQLEWFLAECKKLTFIAYNRHSIGNK